MTIQLWQDGYWLFDDMKMVVREVTGQVSYLSKSLVEFDFPEIKVEPSIRGTWRAGDFGDTSNQVLEATGVQRYNLEMVYNNYVQKGVVSQNGKTITYLGPYGIATGSWLNSEDLQKVLDDRENINELTCPYPKQPDHQGKIIWLSGPPAAGKSSTAHFMAKNHGYVYFEGDTFLHFVNPYFPKEVKNPTLEVRQQRPLKGYSFESMKVILPGATEWSKIIKFLDYDSQLVSNLYREMARFILKEKKRIGGDWVVAQAVPTRQMRDAIKEVLGDQCTFLTLCLSEEANAQRVEERFSGAKSKAAEDMKKMCIKMYRLFESVEVNESHAFNLIVEPDMDISQVTETILKVTQ